jgi:hypothetical protein
VVLAVGMAVAACSGSGSQTSPFSDGGGSAGGGGNSSVGSGGSSGGGGGSSSAGGGGGSGGGGSSSARGGGSSGGGGGSPDGGFAWVPFGPDDPTDPTPDWPAYNALASHRCGNLEGQLDSGEISGNLWQALAAVCAAAVDGDGDQWDVAARAFAAGGETGFTIPCLQGEATAMLERALAWHQLHPGRQPAVRFQTTAGKTDCGLEQERQQQQEQQQSTEATDQSSQTTQQSPESTVSPPESTEQPTETTVQPTETTG